MNSQSRPTRFSSWPPEQDQARLKKQAADDWDALQRWRATEGERLAATAAQLRKQAEKHEALAREAKSAGEKTIANTLALLAQNMRLKAVAAERYMDWKLGQRRRRQLEQWSARGGEATKQAAAIYTDAQRARWLELRASDYARHSQRQAAALIVAREKLPAQSFETVRKALRQENG